MYRIAKFETVSEAQFRKDSAHMSGEPLAVELPVRATAGSAGYDIKTPWAIRLEPGESLRVPTGLRCRIASGWVLLVMPKSGLGFKFRLQLDNTVGVIDSDYAFAENEGHILVKLHNPSDHPVTLGRGERFCQGVFLPFGTAEEEGEFAERTGGMGSTGKE